MANNNKSLTTRKLEYDKIVEFRKLHSIDYLNNIAKLMGYTTISEVFDDGWPITELKKYSDEASKLTWGADIPNRYWKFMCREVCNEYLTEKYGSPKDYFNTEVFIKRRVTNIGNTMETRYGYRNPGQSPEHRELMKKGSNCKNPFSSDSFKYNSYIRGKTVLPEDKIAYDEYRKKVDKLTDINKQNLPFTGICYYTELPIFKYDGNKTINRNDWNMATIDHKISVIAGFLRGISPEIISSVDNLCWCSKYFNSFKGSKCEDEIRLSGLIERFKEVIKKYYASSEGD